MTTSPGCVLVGQDMCNWCWFVIWCSSDFSAILKSGEKDIATQVTDIRRDFTMTREVKKDVFEGGSRLRIAHWMTLLCTYVDVCQ